MFRLISRVSIVVFAMTIISLGCSRVMTALIPNTGTLTFSIDYGDYSELLHYDIVHQVHIPLVTGTLQTTIDARWLNQTKQLLYTVIDPIETSQIMLTDQFGGRARQIYPSIDNDTLTLFEQPIGRIVDVIAVNPEHITFMTNHRRTLSIAQLDLSTYELDIQALAQAEQLRGICEAMDGYIRYVLDNGTEITLVEKHELNDNPKVIQSWSMRYTLARIATFYTPDCSRFFMPLIAAQSLNFELFHFDANTDSATNITNRPLHNDSNVAISNDGQYIAFTSTNDGGYFIIVADIDGQNQRIVHQANALVATITWSPDDTKLAISYQKNSAEGADLCIVDLISATADCVMDAMRISRVVWSR